jgi:ATP-binding protein involved in chromosome partitioning
MQTATIVQESFNKITQNIAQEVVRRNSDLPPTDAIKITTMAGCAAVKK